MEDLMGDTFYAVRRLVNGRAGCLPSYFSSKEEAINFILTLKNRDNIAGVVQEFHLYEVKEIAY